MLIIGYINPAAIFLLNLGVEFLHEPGIVFGILFHHFLEVVAIWLLQLQIREKRHHGLGFPVVLFTAKDRDFFVVRSGGTHRDAKLLVELYNLIRAAF